MADSILITAFMQRFNREYLQRTKQTLECIAKFLDFKYPFDTAHKVHISHDTHCTNRYCYNDCQSASLTTNFRKIITKCFNILLCASLSCITLIYATLATLYNNVNIIKIPAIVISIASGLFLKIQQYRTLV